MALPSRRGASDEQGDGERGGQWHRARGAVFLVFLVLKLTGHIDWSWWWVTAPLWGPVGIFLVIFVVIGVSASIVVLITDWLRRRRRRRRALR